MTANGTRANIHVSMLQNLHPTSDLINKTKLLLLVGRCDYAKYGGANSRQHDKETTK